jgi:hypothetical protein
MDYEELNGILSRRNFDKSIGRLCANDPENQEGIVFTGFPEEHPHFINPIDEELWIESWKANADRLRMFFTNRNFKIEELNAYELVDCCGRMERVLTEYHTATGEYNERIAKPYIHERKELLLLDSMISVT